MNSLKRAVNEVIAPKAAKRIHGRLGRRSRCRPRGRRFRVLLVLCSALRISRVPDQTAWFLSQNPISRPHLLNGITVEKI